MCCVTIDSKNSNGDHWHRVDPRSFPRHWDEAFVALYQSSFGWWIKQPKVDLPTEDTTELSIHSKLPFCVAFQRNCLTNSKRRNGPVNFQVTDLQRCGSTIGRVRKCKCLQGNAQLWESGQMSSRRSLICWPDKAQMQAIVLTTVNEWSQFQTATQVKC